MIIELDETHRLHGTSACWQLEKQHMDKHGEITWKPYKYFTTVSHALREALSEEIRTDKAEGLPAALEAVSRLTDKYARIFDEAKI